MGPPVIRSPEMSEEMAIKAGNTRNAGNYFVEAGDGYLQRGNLQKARDCYGRGIDVYEKLLRNVKGKAEDPQKAALVRKIEQIEGKITGIAEALGKTGNTAGARLIEKLDEAIKFGPRSDLEELGRFLKSTTEDRKYWLWKQQGGKELLKEMDGIAAVLLSGKGVALNERTSAALFTIMFENASHITMPAILRNAMMTTSIGAEGIAAAMQRVMSPERFQLVITSHIGLTDAALDDICKEIDGLILKKEFRKAVVNGLNSGKTAKQAIADAMDMLDDTNKRKVGTYIAEHGDALATQLEVSRTFSKMTIVGTDLPPQKWRAKAWEAVKRNWKKLGARGAAVYAVYTAADWIVFDGSLPFTIIPKKLEKAPEWFANNLRNENKYVELGGKMINEGLSDGLTRVQKEPVLQWKYREYLKPEIVDAAFEKILSGKPAQAINTLAYEDLEELMSRIGSKIKTEAEKEKDKIDYERTIALLELADRVSKGIKEVKWEIDTLAMMGKENLKKLLGQLDYIKLLDLRKMAERQEQAPYKDTLELLGITDEKRQKITNGLATQAREVKELIDVEISRKVEAYKVQHPNMMKWMEFFNVTDAGQAKMLDHIMSRDNRFTEDEVALMQGRLAADKYKQTIEKLLSKLNVIEYIPKKDRFYEPPLEELTKEQLVSLQKVINEAITELSAPNQQVLFPESVAQTKVWLEGEQAKVLATINRKFPVKKARIKKTG